MRPPLQEEIYSFHAQWFDPHAQINRQFNIRYFVESHNIEIIDTKTNRLFLKKTSCPPAITSNDFYLGGRILLHSRTFEIKEYGDAFTRGKLGKQREKSIILLKENGVQNAGKILDALHRNGFLLSSLRMLQLSTSHAADLFEAQRGTPYFDNLVHFHTSNAFLALEVVADDCMEKLKQMVGPLRARYDNALSSIGSSIEVAENALEVARQRKILFDTKHEATAVFDQCTCCVIQPHAVKQGKTGQILDTIQSEGYAITAMEMFCMDRSSAAEFLEVYDGVVPHFQDAVDELASGPCIAMEVVWSKTSPMKTVVSNNNVVSSFRQVVGPWDIEMAKELRPNTVRARFGVDRVKNAVHCTDLQEDGVLESQYFFEILARK